MHIGGKLGAAFYHLFTPDAKTDSGLKVMVVMVRLGRDEGFSLGWRGLLVWVQVGEGWWFWFIGGLVS